MEVGVMGQVFEAPIALAPAITDSWIKECWLNMAHHDIHVKEDIPDFNMPQAGDGELMLAFMKAGFHNKDIAILNQCRMYCWVIFISDICTGAGEQVNS